LRFAEAELRRLSPSAVAGDTRHYAMSLVSSGGEVVAASRLGFVGSLQETAKEILGVLGALEHGDVVVANDPAAGGTHVNDMTLMTPASWGSGYLLARFHTADFGGERLGGLNPSAAEIWAEGARVTPMFLARRGREQADVASLLCLNSRLPDLLRGDLAAASSAFTLADGRLALTPELTGADGHALALAESEAGVAEALANLSAAHRSSILVRHCCTGAEGEIVADVSVAEGYARFDLTGSSAALPAFLNSSRGTSLSALALPFLLSVAPGGAPGGLLRRVRVQTTPGSVVAAQPPHPTGWSPYWTAGQLAVVSADALRATGIAPAHFSHWYADPHPVFALPGCDDPACPYGGRDFRAYAQRYWPEDWV
jgi:N-methylhydantoinase B/oxoprolinase/acetone carboxylase alpha subunit